tara:strand:- start:35 stop:256 length:222 start_codon:yes stop_codon:yes gene_type:complete
MNHNKVDQQLGGFRRTRVNQMSQALFALRPSSRPSIHRSLEQYLGMKSVFQLLLDGEYQNQVMLNLLATNQNM